MNHRPLRRTGQRVLALLTTLLLLSGCTYLGSEPEPTPGPTPTLRVSALQGILDMLPLHVALHHNLFAGQGVEVNLVNTGNGQGAIAKLQSGEIDVAYAGDVAIARAVASGIKLRIIAEAAAAKPNSMLIMVRKLAVVPTVSSLAGKTIAHNGEGGQSDLLIRSLLADHKVNASAIRFRPMEFPLMPAALGSGEIDAALLPEPLASKAAKEAGAERLIDPAIGGAQGIPTGSYVVLEDQVAKNAAAIGAFQRAMQNAAIAATSSRGLVEEVAVKKMGVAPDVAAFASFPEFRAKPSLPELARIPDLINKYSPRKVNVDMAAIVLPFPGS